ncbi:hypothetical protein QMN21_02870, partial [Serratia sp. Se-PFBMAAmG]|nr:hypothetical protein [Serratia sp. Se-PFBMAAmG]
DKNILSIRIISLIITMQLRSDHYGIKRMNKTSTTSTHLRRVVADPYRLPQCATSSLNAALPQSHLNNNHYHFQLFRQFITLSYLAS